MRSCAYKQFYDNFWGVYLSWTNLALATEYSMGASVCIDSESDSNCGFPSFVDSMVYIVYR